MSIALEDGREYLAHFANKIARGVGKREGCFTVQR
jgi:hypothetical protein